VKEQGEVDVHLHSTISKLRLTGGNIARKVSREFLMLSLGFIPRKIHKGRKMEIRF
jgi:hypothetical protein